MATLPNSLELENILLKEKLKKLEEAEQLRKDKVNARGRKWYHENKHREEVKQHNRTKARERIKRLSQDPVEKEKLRAKNREYYQKYKAKNPNFDKERYQQRKQRCLEKHGKSEYEVKGKKYYDKHKEYRRQYYAERSFMEKFSDVMAEFLISLDGF